MSAFLDLKSSLFFLHYKKYLFIGFAGLHCCLFSKCSKQGLFSSCCSRASRRGDFSCLAPRLRGIRASVAATRGLRKCGSWGSRAVVSICGAQIQLLHSMWDFPGPGIKPLCPALQSGFLTPGPLEISPISVFIFKGYV